MDWMTACREAAMCLGTNSPPLLPTDAEDENSSPWELLWKSICRGISNGLGPDEDAEWFWCQLAANEYPMTDLELVALAKTEAYLAGRQDPYSDDALADWQAVPVVTPNGEIVLWDGQNWSVCQWNDQDQLWELPAPAAADDSEWEGHLAFLGIPWDGEGGTWDTQVIAPMREWAIGKGLGARFARFVAESADWDAPTKGAYLERLGVRRLKRDDLLFKRMPNDQVSCRVSGMGRTFIAGRDRWKFLSSWVDKVNDSMCQWIMETGSVYMIGGDVFVRHPPGRAPRVGEPARDCILTLHCRLSTPRDSAGLKFSYALTLSGMNKSKVNKDSMERLVGLLKQHANDPYLPITANFRESLGIVSIPADRGFLHAFLGAAGIPGQPFTLIWERGQSTPRSGKGRTRTVSVSGLDEAALGNVTGLLMEAGMEGVNLRLAQPIKREAKRSVASPDFDSYKVQAQWRETQRRMQRYWDKRVKVAKEERVANKKPKPKNSQA